MAAAQPDADDLPYSRAVLAQLQAEFLIAGLTVKDVAVRLQMDYNTFRRHITGEREMPLSELFAALDVIGLDPVVFLSRVRDRVPR